MACRREAQKSTGVRQVLCVTPIECCRIVEESGFATFMRTLRERDHERIGKKKDEL